MVITDTDLQILEVLAQYYVLTREQIQRFSAAPISSGRSVRRRLLKMSLAELIRKHRIPVALPGKNGAAPVYYLTKNGTEVLADHFNDGTYLGLPTRQPRVDRLNHWVALNETRWTIEQAIASQSEVGLERWINEWETVNKSAHEKEQFYLQTKLSENPPLSCSPDAGFVMSLRGHKKVFYLEQDLGTSSPKQIAARKTKGYAELANRKLHRKHFPETTLDTFTILFITTTAYRSQTTAERIRTRPRPDLWLCIDQHELTPESFLYGPITLNYQGERAALVKPIETQKEIPC
ncbi:replication-relaxation family protein [Gimesia aquarii]|uniref:Replication-relaxation n=1 Tax=Gimesia aquarii TaxID=2527964 RepID=A0A517X077_9PLAN|nr:replication-relaxation family protein [Gimesia aquarii]QDU10902.1 hypothetical protein V202x_43150 [Gimesia aquarii]